MKIVQHYSHLNGLEYLMVRKPTLWQEIQDVIQAVDASVCRTKKSEEIRTMGQMFYSPKDMNAQFRTELNARHWKKQIFSYWVTGDEKLIRQTMSLPAPEQKAEIQAAGQLPLASSNETDFVKDGVAIEVQFGKYAFVAYDLFVKHMAFYVGDRINVGVEILPTKALQREMSSGVPNYENSLYDVIRQGRGVPAVPLIILGIEP